MKTLYDLVLRLSLIAFFVFISLFPVLGLIQWLGPDSALPYDHYQSFLAQHWSYVHDYGDWALVLICSVLCLRFAHPYHETAERIRMNRLAAEHRRWRKTPYIAPYLYFSLISPRNSYSNEFRERVFNEYYKSCVALFRDRVYFDGSFSTDVPEKRHSWIRITGFSIMATILIGLALIFLIFLLLYQSETPSNWFKGWSKFWIPVWVYLVAWVSQLLFAAHMIGGFHDIKENMEDYFQEKEPKITWRDVYPDRPKGEAILHAWEYETADRKAKHDAYKKLLFGSSPPFTECPALAPYPYPKDHIPEWADRMEHDFFHTQEQWRNAEITDQQKQIRDSKGKIVPLKKRRK